MKPPPLSTVQKNLLNLAKASLPVLELRAIASSSLVEPRFSAGSSLNMTSSRLTQLSYDVSPKISPTTCVSVRIHAVGLSSSAHEQGREGPEKRGSRFLPLRCNE